MHNTEYAAAAGLVEIQMLVQTHRGLEQDERDEDDVSDYLVVGV